MITLAWYLLKGIICSGILCGYYFLALRNKAFHRWNRFYILAAIVISVSVPIMKVHIFQYSRDNGNVVKMLQTISYGDQAVIEYSKKTSFQLNTQDIAEAAYLVISAILLLIFFISLYKIKGLKKKYPQTKIEDICFVNTDAKGTPFSFFKSIFWNNAIDWHSGPGQRIFNHEIAHIKEKHSYDKIFMDIVLIFFWINPFFWLMRKELYLIHEFIADKEALEDSDSNAFAEMILHAVYPGQNFSFTNNFFYSPIKRRIMMLAKNKNPKVSYLSRLLVLPLSAIVFFAFTLKVTTGNDAAFKSILHASTGSSVLKIMYDTIPENKKTTQANIISINGTDKINKKKDTKVVVVKEGDAMAFPSIMGTKEDDSMAANALLIVDGKEIPNKEMKNISPQNIQSINVLKGEKAIKKYGGKGKEGAIEITTKNAKYDGFSGTADTVFFKGSFSNPIAGHSDFSGKGIHPDSKIPDGVLLFVDGKEISKDDMKNMDPNNFQSVTILKGESAIKKYGEKAKEGAIEITTKDKSANVDSPGADAKAIYGRSPAIERDTLADKVFTKVENEAAFPGGPAAWQTYIAKKILASLDSFTEADYGTCLLKFIVNTDGSLSDVQATTMKGTHLAKVSIYAIKNGPKWIPASQNGKTVAAYRLQPITLTNPDAHPKKNENAFSNIQNLRHSPAVNLHS